MENDDTLKIINFMLGKKLSNIHDKNKISIIGIKKVYLNYFGLQVIIKNSKELYIL